MNYYFHYFLPVLCIFSSLYSMKPARIKSLHNKELKHSINEDVLDTFLRHLSLEDEKTQLKAYRNAIVQNAHSITYGIPATLKDKLLILAAAYNSKRVAKFLTRLDTYHYGSATDEAFFQSLESKHLKIARLLLAKGANVNAFVQQRQTLLHNFADDVDDMPDEIERVKLLLEYGADPDIISRDNYKRVPLHAAIEEPEVAALVCNAGANPNIKDASGNTPLMNLVDFSYNPDMCNVFAQLMEAGTDIDSQNKNGQTALHRAATTSSKDLIILFRYYGARTDICDNEGKTALEYGVHDTIREIIAGPPPALSSEAQQIIAKIKKKKIKLR